MHNRATRWRDRDECIDTDADWRESQVMSRRHERIHAHGRFVVLARRGGQAEPEQITEIDGQLARVSERGARRRRQMATAHTADHRRGAVRARYRPWFRANEL